VVVGVSRDWAGIVLTMAKRESAPSCAAQAVTWLPVDALRPNPRNPRKHGQEVLQLARTILRTTWGAPIVVQARSNRIIGGHGRLEAAREILAGIEVDGELRGGADHVFAADAPGPAMVPVRIVDVSDAEADAMTLADNARAIQGHDDAAMIVEMASAFERDAAIMADIGLGSAALDALIKQAGDAVLAAGESSADPNGTEYDESVERDLDVVCPHCGGTFRRA
jgi:ParB-like chromosome segregation protein Spo0J